MKLTTYSQNQKIEALKLWLVTGNLTQTAAALKIPYDTVKQWRYSEWWEKNALEIKAEGRIELSAKLKKVAEKALEQTLDRLENGDWQMSPTGELVRRPVAAAVVAKIAVDALQKHEELERTPQETSLQSVNDRLKSLATNFEAFSKKVRKIEVIDVGNEAHELNSEGIERAEDTRAVDQTVEGSWREKPEGTSLQAIEQAGDHEGEPANSEGESQELDESGGAGEGPSSSVFGPQTR